MYFEFYVAVILKSKNGDVWYSICYLKNTNLLEV